MPNQICERTRLLSRSSSLCSLCSVRKCESVPDLLFSTGLFFHVTFIVTFRLLSASLIAVSVKSILIKQQRPFLFFFFRSISEESKICQPAIIQPTKKQITLHLTQHSPRPLPSHCAISIKKSQHRPNEDASATQGSSLCI